MLALQEEKPSLIPPNPDMKGWLWPPAFVILGLDVSGLGSLPGQLSLLGEFQANE